MKPLFPKVVVNDETIPAAEIAAEAQMHPAPKDKPGLAWNAAARALAVRVLLLQAAARSGVDCVPAKFGEGREETTEEALIRAYIEAEVDPAPVTEADCQKAFDARPPEAADLTYDDVVKSVFDSLEKAAWTRAARVLVDKLVSEAQIEGVNMARSEAA